MKRRRVSRRGATEIQRVAVAEARQGFSRILDEVRETEEPVIIEKSGVPVAAVVPLAVLEREQRWAADRAEWIALLGRMRRPFRSVPSDELEARAAEAVRAARKERRRERPGR